MNEQIEMTKQAIVAAINNSKLPIGVVNLIIKDIANQINDVYQQELIKEYAKKSEQTEEGAGE